VLIISRPRGHGPLRTFTYFPLVSTFHNVRRATVPLNPYETRPYHNSSNGQRPLAHIASRPSFFSLLPLFPLLHNIFLAHAPIKQQFNFQYIIPRCVFPGLPDDRKPTEITFLFSLPF